MIDRKEAAELVATLRYVAAEGQAVSATKVVVHRSVLHDAARILDDVLAEGGTTATTMTPIVQRVEAPPSASPDDAGEADAPASPAPIERCWVLT